MSLSVSIIMPALNEEERIGIAARDTLNAFRDLGILGELIIINDGSTDKTRQLAEQLVTQEASRVRLVNHQTPMGIGASFWRGVEEAKHDVIAMFPGDNENDSWEALRYLDLLHHVDIVIPFVFNKHVRPLHRNVLSYLYRFVINTTFQVNFNYTNGTVLYRKSILSDATYKSRSFFFQTDILIRLVKRGYLFAEVPYRLGLRSAGVSKAVSFPSFLKVSRGYLRLIKDMYLSKREETLFPPGSMSRERHREPNPQAHKT